MKTKLSLLPILFLVLIIPTAIAAITEIFKSVLIWHFRIVDFFDLVVTAPLYFVCFVTIYFLWVQNTISSPIKWLYIFCVALFLYGHSMHVTANAIDTYSMEIQGYQDRIPQDVYELVYFLDETLSHILTFFGLYGFLLCFLWIDGTTPDNGDTSNFGALPLGIIYGIGQGIALVEAGKVWVAGLFFISSVIVFLLVSIRTHLGFGQLLRKSVVVVLFSGIVPGQLLSLLVYWLIFGDFIQPSKLGL
ncbi:MAG: hypothetical protein CVU44_02500 [Chloroflexi bacterium HGW-Chloroflexi-6]|nr:MAG: hypothetical protein CVU44_02500 [Chloroflexi bacterium HGW-Chloroflexi-6]